MNNSNPQKSGVHYQKQPLITSSDTSAVTAHWKKQCRDSRIKLITRKCVYHST